MRSSYVRVLAGVLALGTQTGHGLSLSGCINLWMSLSGAEYIVLHELGHAYEEAVRRNAGGPLLLPISRAPDFVAAVAAIKWESTYLAFPEEAFAESFAHYFHSPETRARWEHSYPTMAESLATRKD